jgi:tripartite-type tricarboxylate transporter receptor subunit TctC
MHDGRPMKRSIASIVTWSIALAALASAGAGRQATADEASLAGKTINMTIGFAAGGGVDLYGRTLGRHIVHHLPGNPALVVLNQPGAGGVVALNEWARKAEPNGLNVTVGAQSQTDPDALNRTHAKFDPTTFKMVGGLGAYSQGLFINKDAADRLHDKSARPVVMGMVGSTLRGGTYQVLWGSAFLGWNVKWVRGYPSTSEVRQALDRGEIDMATFGATKEFDYLLKSGKFTIVSQTGYVQGGQRIKRAALGNAPILSDLVRGKIKEPLPRQAFNYWEEVSQIGMWVALPPETPESIADTYTEAFNATMNDSKFQDEYSRVDPDSIVAKKPDIENLVKELAKVTPATLTYLEAELKRQGFGVGP